MCTRSQSDPVLSSSFLQAAYSVLNRYRRPLPPRAITDIAFEEGYLDPDRPGQTPAQTMKSKLSQHIRAHGDRSLFVRTGPGKYFLRSLLEETGAEDDSPPPLPSGPGRFVVRSLLDEERVHEYQSPPFRAGRSHEQVLVVPQRVVDEVGRFQGISTNCKPYSEAFLEFGVHRRMDRMAAEDTDAFKQLLSYILIRREDGGLLCFDRGSVNRADDSLRGRACVGFGGHVTYRDRTLFDGDEAGLFRSAAAELMEELRLPERDARRLDTDPSGALNLVGVLNDDSSANGKRHFAFVFEYRPLREVEWRDPPRGRERSIKQVRWLTTTSARSEPVHRFEYWSQLCLRRFSPDLASATPSFKIRRKAVLRNAKVVCLVGQIGSGKTEAAGLLRKELALAQVNSGQVLAELLGVAPVPDTPREEFQRLARTFIESDGGPEQLGGAIADRALEAEGRVLVDGLRHVETLSALRAGMKGSGVAVIYVHAPFDIAYEFYRRREDPGVTIETFARRRSSLVESDIERFFDMADAALYNWIGLGAYIDTVRHLASECLA